MAIQAVGSSPLGNSISSFEIEDGAIVNADVNASAAIEAGKILISATTTLSDWRKTGDLTKIDGADIADDTVADAALSGEIFTFSGTHMMTVNFDEVNWTDTQSGSGSWTHLANYFSIHSQIGAGAAYSRNSLAADFSKNIVLTFYVKASAANTFIKSQISLGNGYSDGGGANEHIGLDVSSDGSTITGVLTNADGTQTKTAITGVTWTDWNQIVIVHTTGTNLKCYVNGTLKATSTTNLPTALDNDTGYVIEHVGDASYNGGSTLLRGMAIGYSEP